MIAQQLAEAATEKKKKSWDELVPKQYHDLEKVFSETTSERFPEQRCYDHTIDLMPDAPTSIDCRVYPLSPKEKEELLCTDLRNRISTYHSGILTLSDLTTSNFTTLVKMYTLYTKLSYTKTGRLEVRDHKGRLKVLIYMTRPSLGGLGLLTSGLIYYSTYCRVLWWQRRAYGCENAGA